MDTISRIEAGIDDEVTAQVRAGDNQLVRTARKKAKQARFDSGNKSAVQTQFS